MKVRIVLFFMLAALSFNSQSSVSFATGVAVGSVIGAANNGGDNFISKKFDYVIACALKYEEIKHGNYKYFCPNPPPDKLVLFMSTVFDTDYWPTRIVYYMKGKE